MIDTFRLNPMRVARTLLLGLLWIVLSLGGASAGESMGKRIRKELDEQGLALVDWHRGSDGKGEYYVEFVTSPKKAFDDAEPWDGLGKPQLPMERLVQLALEIAKQESKEVSFEGLMINPCEDDPAKRFVTVSFQDPTEPDWKDVAIDLLLNGSSTKTTRRPVTAEEYGELEEHGIPKSGEQGGAGQPADPSESKSEERSR